MTGRLQSRLALLAIPPLFAAIAAVQVGIDARTRSAENQKQELLLQSPSLVRRMSLGYDPLLADIYWTRSVQYYGARIGKPNEDFGLLWPLLDITVTLDPKLMPAYRFGAIFLSEAPPIGAGRTDLAVELTKRGIAANPDEWRLWADLGFLYYWRMKDYQHASAAYLAASNFPKAPPWLKLMAARVAEKGGSVETSRLIWTELLESTTNARMRDIAREKLRGLKVQDDEAHINEAVAEFRARFGRYPSSTVELQGSGILPGIPVDPDGFPYVIGLDGKAQLFPTSTMATEEMLGNPAR
jgi:hypothetical protein